MKTRAIAVVTTSRADYGLLARLMRAIEKERGLTLQVVATGGHLSKAFGMTADAIKADGFKISARVPMTPASDSHAAVARALGEGALGFARELARLKPDLLVVLGDRWELLAACSAAVALRIPIAHLHGGEASEGTLDEQVRHAVTKLAHLHFTAAEPYRRRVVAMGEDPRRVFNAGAPGLETLREFKPLTERELTRLVGMPLTAPLALVTVHPETVGARSDKTLDAVLSGLDRANVRAVLTYAGSDAGGRAINARLGRWAAARPGRAKAVASLGSRGYLSLLARADAVVGNSSSGIIEAPSLKTPTINVGSRQDGRLRAPSVIDCAANASAVAAAIRRALSPAFRARCRGKNPYGAGPVSAKIVAVLKRTPLKGLLIKRFYEGS
ncbi:MAG: UDP-N-acetylglucosamine 2-epimerase (hydrolyzing) [Elusimicrobia bacterium]|nr:UDP-N-acetylglucosamine 2-epimerase (hydrolyzing) [Elusimicrobiota bacterium]